MISLEYFSRNSCSVRIFKKSINANLRFLSVFRVDICLISDDFPHRLGDMSIVLIPADVLLRILLISLVLLMKLYPVTIFPNLNGEFIFIPIDIIPYSIILIGIHVYIFSHEILSLHPNLSTSRLDIWLRRAKGSLVWSATRGPVWESAPVFLLWQCPVLK